MRGGIMGHKILWNTKKFIDERSSKDFARDGYWFSLWGSIIMGLTVLLIGFTLSKKGYPTVLNSPKNIAIVFIVSFSVYYLLNILGGYITRDVVSFLKKDISFAKALASVSYSLFLISVGFALMSITAIFPGIYILSPIIGIIVLARSYGIYIRFLHEYAKLQNIDAYIVSVIVIGALTLGFVLGTNLISLLAINL